jgi:hypothetical protein
VTTRYGDRLNLARYADDEPVRVYVPGGEERWVSERLWHRLVSLGAAYEMHLLPLLLGTTAPQILNGQQVNALREEIEFLISIVDDEALSLVVTDLQPLLVEAKGGDADALVIEGP